MENRILFTALIAGIMLASCGIVKNNDFTSRKYTNFHKGVASVTSKTDQVKPEAINSRINETAFVTEQNIQPVTLATPVVRTSDDKQTEKNVFAENTISTTKNTSTEKKREIKLKSLQSKVLARLADKPNTTSEKMSDVDPVVLVILAILLPPLAVYLALGICNQFWIDLVLALLIVLYPVAIIYALIVIFR